MAQSKTYVTKSGDTWDMIAFKFYKDETLCDKIMNANRQYLDIMIFPAGVELEIPLKSSFTDSTVLSDNPTWRALLNG